MYGIQYPVKYNVLLDGSLYILNHTSNTKSNRTLNITYIVSSIVTQFYQKLKHLFMKMKVELHQSIILF